ncbi:MAG: cupin domain-containing protein [Pseudomonadota bacterium]
MGSPRHIAFDDLEFAPRFEYGHMAQAVEVCGTDDLTELGTGFARMTNAEIPWTVKYDEIILVIEGEFSVETGEGTITAGPKDSIWLPKGTKLTYRAESALVFYAIHPANWAE